MDTLKLAGEIPDVSGGHGVAVDPKTGHGFSSSSPVVMFDTKTMKVIKTITVEGRPDGIFFEPSTNRVYVLSHRAPHVTAINTADGTIAGTFDLGGAARARRVRRQGPRLYLRGRPGAGCRCRLQGDEDHRALRSGRQRRPAGGPLDGRGEQCPLCLLPRRPELPGTGRGHRQNPRHAAHRQRR